MNDEQRMRELIADALIAKLYTITKLGYKKNNMLPTYKRHANYKKHNIKIHEAKACEEILRQYNWNTRRLKLDINASNRNTIFSFRKWLYDTKQIKYDIQKPIDKLRASNELFGCRLKQIIEQFHNHPELKQTITDTLSRFITWCSRYTPILPILNDKLYLKYSACVSCNQLPPPDGYDIAYVGTDKQMPLPLCNKCSESSNTQINWKYAAELYLSYAILAERTINDITRYDNSEIL